MRSGCKPVLTRVPTPATQHVTRRVQQTEPGPCTDMATPKKSVHWGTNNSFSDTAESLSFASTSSDTCSSALEYVNAQLVAHGFAPPPGLSLDGISNANAERVSKCLLDLLGQRTVNKSDYMRTCC